jgi:hypothetical protein
MSWTHEQLRKLGYHLHPDGNYYPDPPPQKLPDPIPQHNPIQPLVKPSQAQKKGKIRVGLRIERVATKLQDFDNFVGGTKPLTDQLREAGLISDDDPESIDARYSQQKCRHLKDEKTIVHLFYSIPSSPDPQPPAQPDKH